MTNHLQLTNTPSCTFSDNKKEQGSLRRENHASRITQIICFLTLFSTAHAEPLKVNWAGLSFLGAASDKARQFPFASALLDQCAHDNSSDNCRWQTTLQAALTTLNNPHLSLQIAGKSSGAQDDAIALSFALDRELSSHETIGEDHKLLTELSGQALFVDLKEKKVLASYPFATRHIDTLKHVPDDAERAARIEGLFNGLDGANIVNEFIKTLSHTEPKRAWANSIRVTSVKINEGALAYLPAPLAEHLESLHFSVAMAFSRELSRAQHIPVLPYADDAAQAQMINMTMLDGTAYMVKIPEPDYHIELTLDNFKKLELEKNAAASLWLYGSYLGVRVYEPLSNKVFFDSRIKNGESKIVPSSQTVIDDWAAYQASLSALLRKFADGLIKPDKEWVKRHIGDNGDLNQLQDLKTKVIEKCR